MNTSKKVLIIGGGFAGQALVKKLSKNKKLKLILLDKNIDAAFKPLLPDIISKNVCHKNIKLNLQNFCKHYNVEFFKEEAIELDAKNSLIKTKQNAYLYDYLVISSGSKTNFHNNQVLKEHALKLETTDDALTIMASIKKNQYQNIVINGGGYTGLEIATHIKKALHKQKIEKEVFVVEYSDQILKVMPSWIKEYILKQIKKLNIKTIISNSAHSFEGDNLKLNDGQIINDALLIWTAGITTANYIKKTDFKLDNMGRISVNKDLSISDKIFVAGDSASFEFEKNQLRPSVRFSISQGNHIAKNIKLALLGKKLKEFKPFDPGYIVPLANYTGAGYVFKVKIKGILATILHYLLSIWFVAGTKNKLGLVLNLIFRKQ